MDLPIRLTAALRSLNGAVDLLQAAAERRTEADAARADLETELHLMGEDRARLAQDLDASQARCASLGDANRAVSRKLDSLIGALQSQVGDSDRTTARGDAE